MTWMPGRQAFSARWGSDCTPCSRAWHSAGMDSFSYSDSIIVNAGADALYDLVTDIARTGEWSPVCRGCHWREGEGLRVGAWFTGHNEADGRVWDTESQVAVAERGREFSWLVGGTFVRWSFRFSPAGEGTRLTEAWEFLPAGLAMFRGKYGPDADRQIELRRSQAISGIPATLAAIKRIAEHSDRETRHSCAGTTR